MHAEMPSAPSGPRFLTPYSALWGFLATLAIAYFALLTLRPEILAQYWPGLAPSGSLESAEGQSPAIDPIAEVQSLRETLDRVQEDVAKLKSDVSAQSALAQGWETRIAALETKSDAAATAAAAAETSAPASNVKTVNAKPAKETKKAETSASKASAAAADGAGATMSTTAAAAAAAAAASRGDSAPPAAAPAPKAPEKQAIKVINAPTTAAELAPGVETGSVATPAAVSFGPAVVSSEPKRVGVVIASGNSVDSLRLSWSLLADRNASSLGSLEPRYTTGIDATGLTYDLVAGPVKSAAEAKKLCKELAAKAVTCRVSDFTGEAL